MSTKTQRNLINPGVHYVQGAQACAEGALVAGCRVYGGYPITPATEIMEHFARRLPQVGGRTIQMEDEISAASLLLGASLGRCQSHDRHVRSGIFPDAGSDILQHYDGNPPGDCGRAATGPGPGIYLHEPGRCHASSVGAPRRRRGHCHCACLCTGDV